MEHALMAALLAPLHIAEAGSGFAPDLSAFLAPLEDTLDGPAGPSLRYDTVYARIREARSEEDASLPMGEWTRPLKKADWRAAETLCTEVLLRRSKDLQVAAWLAEAWTHRHGIDGLIAGARLLEGLARGFWDDAHPRIGEDGDSDMRAATFVWINDTLAQVLLMRVPLLAWPDFSPPFINLADWQRALSSEYGSGAAAAAGNARSKVKEVAEEPSAQTVSRQDILERAARDLHALAALDDRVALVADIWDELTLVLDERLGTDAPSLSKVTEMLARMRQALRSLLQDRDPRDEQKVVAAQEPVGWTVEVPAIATTSMDDDDMSQTTSPPLLPASSEGPIPTAARGRIGSRAEAYQLLELAAAYLMREEPHSPTPYLVNRAVAWGRMPLPQLMQEVLREDGDLNRYFSIIGVRPDA